MVTKYISSTEDGTGDWECDGEDDQNIINTALQFAYEYGTSASPVTIYLRGPFTFGISGRLFIGSNTILTGDSTACIRVQDYACGNNIPSGSDGAYCVFPDGSPVISQIVGTIPSNIEIFGFELDGNCQNQYTTLGIVHPGTASEQVQSAGSGVERLIGFYGSSTGSKITNVKVHHMRTYDCFGESLIVRYGQNIQYYNNIASNHQHETVYFIGLEGTNLIQNCQIEGITSDCIRLSNCVNVDVSKNTLQTYYGDHNNGAYKRGQGGIQVCNEGNKPILTDNINIYENSILDQGLAGIWLNDTLKTAGSTPQRVWIHDNTIKECGWSCGGNWASGISISPWGNGIVIEDNSIDGCYQEGIQVLSTIDENYTYTVDIKHNSITNTRDKRAGSESTLTVVGYGIYNALSASLFDVRLQNNTLSSNLNGDTYGEFTLVDYEVIKIISQLGMYAAEPSYRYVPNIEDDEIEDGDQGIMIPTSDGHYTFQKFQEPQVGQMALIYPAHTRGEYYLLRVAENLQEGQRVIAVPDSKGRYWPILAK